MIAEWLELAPSNPRVPDSNPALAKLHKYNPLSHVFKYSCVGEGSERFHSVNALKREDLICFVLIYIFG